ncbi:MAG: hypothetical protein U5L96_05205 [Owenweeksia sp.]|nr:hypothetical protein [Owenweeksia sp.]
MKNILLLFASAVLISGCQPHKLMQNQAVGYAQGTTYQIKYLTPAKQDWKPAFDSIFARVDYSLSTYLDTSLITSY